MLHRAINQDGGYSSRRLTRIDEPPSAQWAMATRLPFFRISLSTLAEANSRRNRSISASSSFADRGVADTPVDVPSLPYAGGRINPPRIRMPYLAVGQRDVADQIPRRPSHDRYAPLSGQPASAPFASAGLMR
jgi:hypothetical protein